MKKWVLRLVLAVLTVVTCGFAFRDTEAGDRSLLYQKVQTMTEDYLGMEGVQPEEYTILDYAENPGEGRLSIVALYRNNTSGVESNILFWEQRGTGRVTVGVGLPLRYDADDGGFCLEEPDVICVSFHNEATGQIYDYRLTYTWHEESDGPMITNDERVRDLS